MAVALDGEWKSSNFPQTKFLLLFSTKYQELIGTATSVCKYSIIVLFFTCFPACFWAPWISHALKLLLLLFSWQTFSIETVKCNRVFLLAISTSLQNMRLGKPKRISKTERQIPLDWSFLNKRTLPCSIPPKNWACHPTIDSQGAINRTTSGAMKGVATSPKSILEDRLLISGNDSSLLVCGYISLDMSYKHKLTSTTGHVTHEIFTWSPSTRFSRFHDPEGTVESPSSRSTVESSSGVSWERDGNYPENYPPWN